MSKQYPRNPRTGHLMICGCFMCEPNRERRVHPSRIPVGTIVTVPDGGAEPVTGRMVRHDDDQLVVAKLDDPTYEVWATPYLSDVEVIQ